MIKKYVYFFVCVCFNDAVLVFCYEFWFDSKVCVKGRLIFPYKPKNSLL